MGLFKLHAPYEAKGDQPQAIEKLVAGFRKGNQFQTLLGVTGSGKTFTMANVIEKLDRPTLIISHNKTLAAQLYSEMKEFFPENSVEYFVSYYDYYQPEAYLPSSDTYIEKDADVNKEIERLRLSATMALCERRDTVIISTVSCIYGLGSPVDYKNMVVSLRPGQTRDRDEVIKELIHIQYNRSEFDFKPGNFRVRGDVLEVFPAESEKVGIRIEFFGDEIDRIVSFDPLTSDVIDELQHVGFFPTSNYVVEHAKLMKATEEIEKDLEVEVREFRKQNKLLEAQRLFERTGYDVEMLRETGICSGIENYTRYLTELPPGAPPYTLMDYFPEDYLIIIDESHITVPQIRGMFNGNLSRKETLVEYGFRLKSAMDNRPLCFEEFEEKINQLLFVSATPGDYEADHELLRAEQLLRPTGLLDPEISVRKTKGQIDDLISEIRKTVNGGNKVLITTLTKKMAEDLTDYLRQADIRVRYLHSDIDTLERSEIIRDMRLDVFDVLVGINLLREGLDIPEIALVAILDADKEGFLRSERSLIQTVGRAARNAEGRVIMYADNRTESMEKAISETNRRRKLQMEFNEAHNITPTTIKKEVRELITISKKAERATEKLLKDPESMSRKELEKLLSGMEKRMKKAAAELDFETAIALREKIKEIAVYLNE